MFPSTTILFSSLALAVTASALANIGAMRIFGRQMYDIPECAFPCLVSGTQASTSCDVEDTYCHCTTGTTEIENSSLPCLCNSACSADELEQANQAVNSICSSAVAASGSVYSPSPIPATVCDQFRTTTMTMTATYTGSTTTDAASSASESASSAVSSASESAESVASSASDAASSAASSASASAASATGSGTGTSQAGAPTAGAGIGGAVLGLVGLAVMAL